MPTITSNTTIGSSLDLTNGQTVNIEFTPAEGDVRYNTTTCAFEYYSCGIWLTAFTTTTEDYRIANLETFINDSRAAIEYMKKLHINDIPQELSEDESLAKAKDTCEQLISMLHSAIGMYNTMLDQAKAKHDTYTRIINSSNEQ